MDRRGFLPALLIVALAAATSCGTGAPVRLAELPAAAQLRKHIECPLRYSVALGPVVQNMEQKPDAVYAAAVEPDTGAIREGLAGVLRDFGIFKSLQPVDASDETGTLDAARKQGSDLLLTAKVVRHTFAYDHGTRGFGCLMAWLLSPWASWLVGDEVFRGDVGLLVTIRRTDDGSTIWEKRVDGKASCELDDLQRGLKTHEYLIGSIITSPGSFDRSNYEKVARVVGPHAMQDLHLNLVNELRQLPQPPPESKSFAVVVGVNTAGNPQLPALKYAEADARAMAEALGRAGCYSEVKLLAGGEATAAAVRAAFAGIGALEYTEVTDLLFYFAGPGAIADGKHYLALADSRDTQTMLSMEELHALAGSINAASRVVILDTGFAGEGGRGALVAGSQPADFPPALSKSTSIATILACGPAQTGHEFDALAHGVFTFHLLEALAGQADINSDKVTAADEIVTFLEWPVERYVRDNTVGHAQKPTLMCDKAAAAAAVVRTR